MLRNAVGTTSYYLQDGLGSTMQLTDANGTITDSYTYDAFGAMTSHTGTNPQPFGYTGQQQDVGAEGGMLYLRAREYAPALGRFLTQDPLNGQEQRYSYADGDPIDETDPMGLCGLSWHPSAYGDCPVVLIKKAVNYARSPWNEAQFVQGAGYVATLTCGTGIGCAIAGGLIAFSWAAKFKMICDEIHDGKLTVKEGSKKFLISLAPSPGIGQAPGASIVGGKILERFVPHETVFPPPFEGCER